MVSTQLKHQHLLWRTGFGIAASEIADSNNKHLEKQYDAIRAASSSSPKDIVVATNVIGNIMYDMKSAGNAPVIKKDSLSAETKKEIQKQTRQDISKLNLTWLTEMVNSEAQLREKMSLFWHGHFASRIINIYYQQLLLNTVRTNALGNFGDLLKAVSKSASMLSFLNNQQNRKQHPNENFAREVMELFTMGRGNYTEQDVKEAARAFTGWGFDKDGNFKFRPFLHDDGPKTFLGKQGNFDGDDILNIILEQKQTALFITQKIYFNFVNETADNNHVKWLADRFYKSNYNIQLLMDDIFTSHWFYEEKNIGANIKSPVELLVGIRRVLPMQLENEVVQLLLQKALGQLLFYPPNVAGWAGGKSWIDSSTLMLRLRIPQLLKNDDTFHITTKQDDDVQMGMAERFINVKMGKNKPVGNDAFQMRANIDWTSFTKEFADVKKENLYTALQSTLLQTPSSS
ncbi:MAG: DUF1800 domain-containing protein, partial [Bacteroidota bacterium]|nr:DUF1800 domain-containing protein [Bacteroidota bacterium]